ncbi:MAG: hypothetical protein OXG11_11920 [Chloroflexi bacterium]|nr:hypothetical protein [Chloroflexota bacterium]
MAYTLPPIAVTGEIITAAWGNDVRNALAVLKTGLTSDVGSFRATLNGTAAVDTGIARPALVNTNGRDEWGMVNFGDYTALVDFTTAFSHDYVYRSPGTWHTIPVGGDYKPPNHNEYIDERDRFYFGHSATFSGVEFVFDVVPLRNRRVGDADWEYWNGSSWTDLDVTDGTRMRDDDGNLLDGTWVQDGLVSWSIPDDWAQNSVNSVSRYWVRFRALNRHGDGAVLGTGSGTDGLDFATILIEAAATTGGLGRDAEWPIIRLNDLHDTTICPVVSAGDVLSRSNSLVFADAVADGEDAYLAVLSNGNLAIGVSTLGVHALPFTIKTLKANRLA